MKRTPSGTPVGTDDPLEAVERCDWVTGDGRCRFALDRADADPAFASDRRANDYRCPYVDGRAWSECPHARLRLRSRRCARCGLEDRPIAHDPDATALLHEHHLAYPEADGIEVTVTVCRWCHAKIHRQAARLDDEAEPDPDALAELERRRQLERAETFTPASARGDPTDED